MICFLSTYPGLERAISAGNHVAIDHHSCESKKTAIKFYLARMSESGSTTALDG